MAAASNFSARIYRSDKSPTSLIIPQPVLECKISRVAKLKEHDVPLLKRALSFGLTTSSRIITVSGLSELNANTGSMVSARVEQTAYTSIESLDSYLDQYNLADTGGLEFIYYHKSTATTYYRKFKNCLCLSFDFDLGDSATQDGWFPWSFVLVARDPVIYTTAPGS